MMHRIPVVDTGILQRVEKPYQIMVTKGEGRIFVTEIWPDKWRAWRYDPSAAVGGGWASHIQGTGCYFHCDAHDAPEQVRSLVQMALSW